MSKKNGLKPEERDELENWTPGFLSLEVHNELEFQINECRQGREDAVVIGPRGTGKTHAVEHFCSQLAHKEVARSIEDPSYQPEEILYFESSLARGRKTGLLDLYEQVYGGGSVVGSYGPPARRKRRTS